MPEPFILVDGSSYLFRAYHALPALSNAEGEPTGAIYGTLNMLRKLIKTYTPTYMAVVFDPKGKTTRHAIDPHYKANRAEMPEELAAQIQPLHDIIRAMGLPLIVVDGIEADDIIGTLAKQRAHAGSPVIISTGDKDMAQLVDEKITLINTMTDSVLDTVGVTKKFGVAPDQIIDYLALMGDSIDNIPGIPGVGPKTAAKWLAEYGALDEIIKRSDAIKGKVGENLRASLAQLPLAKQLTTIQCDIDLPIELSDLKCREPDRAALKNYFEHLGFKRWLVEVNDASGPQNAVDIILTQASLDTWLAEIKEAGIFAFDTETTGLNPRTAELVGFSFCVKAGRAAYVPLAHDYEAAPKQLDRDKTLAALKPLLEDPTIKVIGQNLKYDSSVLHKYAIKPNNLYDTLLASYVLNSTATRHNLDSLAFYYLSKTITSFEDVAGKGKKQRPFNQIPLETAGPYAAEDADIALQLYKTLASQLAATPSLQDVFEQIEMPLLPVLAAMEEKGVLIDAEKLKQQSKTLSQRIDVLAEQIVELAGGEPFNLNSPKQLQDILFNKLKLPVIKKTPKGQPSTAESVLQTLSVDYPLPKLILEYRTLSKLKSTYTDPLPEQIDPVTGRVHCSYNQAVTATGRLSSTSPNLQNIPVRTQEGQQIRQAFIAPKGFKLVAVDYSQVELRIMAHISQDKGLLDAFSAGLDIHKATAAEVFDTPLDRVTAEQRRHAKAINFGLIYGMSAFGLAKQLGVDKNTAQDYIDRYFERYPGVLAYMENARKQAHEKGFVETLYGRRLYLPEIASKNFQRRSGAERAAINGPMQGSSADIIKLAMITIYHWLQTSGLPCYLLMQVHDELVFEVAEEVLDAVIPEIERCMTETWQAAQPFKVQLAVDVSVGDNWGKK